MDMFVKVSISGGYGEPAMAAPALTLRDGRRDPGEVQSGGPR
jgi:hypothetical protein